MNTQLQVLDLRQAKIINLNQLMNLAATTPVATPATTTTATAMPKLVSANGTVNIHDLNVVAG